MRKKPVDCHKLWATCLGIAGTKFVSLSEGISGEIGSLVVDKNYVDDSPDLPIDTLVVDLTREDVEVAEFGHEQIV